MIVSNLIKVNNVTRKFKSVCSSFYLKYSLKADLVLGWGFVRGVVKKISNDYVGSNVNKAARLCNVARPTGVVLDAEDFPKIPDIAGVFTKQEIELKGIAGKTKVWVSKEVEIEQKTNWERRRGNDRRCGIDRRSNIDRRQGERRK